MCVGVCGHVGGCVCECVRVCEEVYGNPARCGCFPSLVLLCLIYTIVRTPLNAIIGMLDITLGTELDNKQREYLTSVQFAADSLLRIVNDVLDIRYCAPHVGHLDKIFDFK